MQNVYDRCLLFLQLWTALGVILSYLWPYGAVLHNDLQATIVDYIPLSLLRLWELWGTLQDLWGYFN